VRWAGQIVLPSGPLGTGQGRAGDWAWLSSDRTRHRESGPDGGCAGRFQADLSPASGGGMWLTGRISGPLGRGCGTGPMTRSAGTGIGAHRSPRLSRTMARIAALVAGARWGQPAITVLRSASSGASAAELPRLAPRPVASSAVSPEESGGGPPIANPPSSVRLRPEPLSFLSCRPRSARSIRAVSPGMVSNTLRPRDFPVSGTGLAPRLLRAGHRRGRSREVDGQFPPGHYTTLDACFFTVTAIWMAKAGHKNLACHGLSGLESG
jgi:hypothetical protein